MKQKLLNLLLVSVGLCTFISAEDVEVDFLEEKYSISSSIEQKATISFNIDVEELQGDYRMEFGAKKGKFSSGISSLMFVVDDEEKVQGFSTSKQQRERNFQVALAFPSQHIPSFGTYTAFVPINIYQGKALVASKLVCLFFPVEKEIDAYVYTSELDKGDNSIFVDFEKVDKKKTQDLFLEIYTNQDVKVSISSNNQGRMILDDDASEDYGSQFIPYVVQALGSEVSLSTKTELFSKSFSLSQGKISERLTFVLKPDMQKNFSGTYKDRVCITISGK